MHPYLLRLGVRREVREFFAPYFHSDAGGNLLFDYGDATEYFGLVYHRIPVSENCWLAGNPDFNMISLVFICSSAMEAIAFYHFRYAFYPQPERLLFLSVGTRPNISQFRWIIENLPGKQYLLVFGNSLLDKAGEVVTAAALAEMPLTLTFINEEVQVRFRLKEYLITAKAFSLNAIEKLSGRRFAAKTARAKNSADYLTQLKSAAFNH
ncbi:hypothetical protein ACCC92_03170 [Mucilaginibacter sp. Mucisp84]|uniref:hypothetical protein n=1 Tax=Mucilaginibacter sp. Mucisp84 TaxID=3243058 RepID=UPI0039A76859